MNATRTTDYGIALLRISLGVMFIAHSIVLKYFTYTLAGTAQFFESLGLPRLPRLRGFRDGGGRRHPAGARRSHAGGLGRPPPGPRRRALVHAGNGWVVSSANGGWEYPSVLIAPTAAQVLLGEGAFALSRAPGRAPRALASRA